MLYVVGIGPGGPDHLTGRAAAAIEAAEAVVGYGFYLDLLGERLTGKRLVATGMTREVERCREAVRLALEGTETAVVSTGDPGVYGMAGLVLELLEEMDPEGRVEVEIVPGVSAVTAAASVLGAPLMHDFAVLSLSDLLTPWALIEKRLDAAGAGDFVVALYNPKSKKRTGHLARALEILGRHRGPTTPVGIVRNALRPGQSVAITTLDKAAEAEADMMSVVVVGSSATRIVSGRMVTPRGYHLDE